MKILVAYPTRPSFVARDIEILKREHFVIEHSYYSPMSIGRGIRAVADCEMVFLWFASQRALPLVLAARMMGKPVVTVVGGYEAANCPEIEYGNARSERQKRFTRMILNRSQAIVAVSHSSKDSIVKNLGIDAARVSVIYHGFEDTAKLLSASERSTVLTVGRLEKESWLVKGLREFFLVARELPRFNFVLIGNVADYNREDAIASGVPNLSLIGEVPFTELGTHYARAKVYLQASRHESFGCSVAEAMLHGCIPVVRNVYALPEVVGDCGVIFKGDKVEAIVAAVRMAMSMDSSEGEKARQHVLLEFSYQRRQTALLRIIDTVGKTLSQK
ncbi:MAG: glycosyltransferase family 4 protein [bacterium]|nr:glycosyltransferase family 4 protein [bacterium]